MRSQLSVCRTILILALSLLPATATVPYVSHAAGPWYVAPNGDDSNSCSSASTPCATINGALNKSGFVAGDTILVATGVYTDTGDQVVLLEKSATLSGGWNAGFTEQSGMSTIDGQNQRRGVYITYHTYGGEFTAQIERFRITAGHAAPPAAAGGGIATSGLEVTLRDCEVSNNDASYEGGGIYHGSGMLRLYDSSVSGNTSGENGGGIYSGGSLILNNSTVSGNRAGGTGGGIFAAGAVALALYSSTISDNWTMRFAAGGVDCYNGLPLVARNSIIAANTAGGVPSDFLGAVTSGGHNLFGYTGDFIQYYVPGPGDVLDVDAVLGPLQGSPGYQPLLPGSPAIDAGDPEGCADDSSHPLPADQRGSARFRTCDIGAYELQPIGFSTLTVNQSAAFPGDSLTYTIGLKNPGATDITNVQVTDTLPASLSYVDNSLTATGGSFGYQNGVIIWTGSVNAAGAVIITYRATLNPILGFVVNSAVISGSGESVTRTATVTVDGLPCNLTKHGGNPVLAVGAGSSWDDDDVWGPTVLKEGSRYMMWYTGADGANPSRIGLATSTDGTTWMKEAANPVLSPNEVDSWEAKGLRVGSVIHDSGLFKMWYTGLDSNGKGHTGYATSVDGVNWSKYEANPVLNAGDPGSWEDESVSRSAVIKDVNIYHLWYTGDDGMTQRIGHATSTDGIHWTKDPANPVFDIGLPGGWDWLNVYGPSVVKVGANTKLWYSGQTLPPAWQTGYAQSSNGGAWRRGQMLIPEGPSGAFDAASADYPSVMVAGDKFKVWYSGLNNSGNYTIGYAIAGICRGLVGSLRRFVYLPLVIKSPANSCPAYYTDNFSDSTSGWPVFEDANRKYAYVDGQYQIWVKNPSSGWSVTPGAKATDFTAAVSAHRTSGTTAAYGIQFGINEDWSELYEFVVEDTSFSIWRYQWGGWSLIHDWTASSYIHTGTTWNRLKVIRDGESIAAYVNDQLLTTFTDSNFIGLKRIGLVAYSTESKGCETRFDDFSLYPDSCGTIAAGVGFDLGEPGAHEAPVPPGPVRLR